MKSSVKMMDLGIWLSFFLAVEIERERENKDLGGAREGNAGIQIIVEPGQALYFILDSKIRK